MHPGKGKISAIFSRKINSIWPTKETYNYGELDDYEYDFELNTFQLKVYQNGLEYIATLIEN